MSTAKAGRVPKRLVTTVFLSVLSMILALADPSAARVLCVPAMLLSSFGDVILMNYRPITRHLPFRGFVAGSTFFLLSHVVYCAAFLVLLNRAGETYYNDGAFVGVVLFVLCGVILTYLNMRTHSNKFMLMLVIVYLFVICTNCSAICAAAFALGGIRYISAVGIVFFLISDMIIMAQTVRDRGADKFMVPIWITYVIGQVLLLCGA